MSKTLSSFNAGACTGFFYVQGWTVYRKEPWMAVRLCTACTVCRGAMDGKERRMYKMLRRHIWLLSKKERYLVRRWTQINANKNKIKILIRE